MQNEFVTSAKAALDAFEAATTLDLEREQSSEVAIWHLLVSLRELAQSEGWDFADVTEDAMQHEIGA